METIRGRMSLPLDFNGLKGHLKNYNRIVLDLGTGDGRYVRALAENHPDWFIVGVDACRENLRDHSRAKLPNMLFIVAPAQQLPCEFEAFFSHVSINFPWGSLLDGLLFCDTGLMRGLTSISRPNAQIEIHLNGGALKEAGTSLEVGAGIIYENLHHNGWEINLSRPLDQDALTRFPTTWARRLAHGRDPSAMRLSGRRV